MLIRSNIFVNYVKLLIFKPLRRSDASNSNNPKRRRISQKIGGIVSEAEKKEDTKIYKYLLKIIICKTFSNLFRIMIHFKSHLDTFRPI